MSDYPHPIIAREGWTFLAIAVVVAALPTSLGYVILAVLAWLVVAFIARFFRDPLRKIPREAVSHAVAATDSIIAEFP